MIFGRSCADKANAANPAMQERIDFVYMAFNVYLWNDLAILSNQEKGEVGVGDKRCANSGTVIQYRLAERGLASGG